MTHELSVAGRKAIFSPATRTLAGVVFSLLVGCASTPAIGPAGEPSGRVIELEDYTVSPPPGTDWVVEVNQQTHAVNFERQKVWLTGRVLGATTILVMQNEIVGDRPILDEEIEAGRFQDNEVAIMKEEGVKKGSYDLYDVARETVTVDGMKLYALRYKQSVRQGVMQPAYTIESVLYLYFPPDLKERRRFYVFHISDGKENYSLTSVDTRQIEPVIRSFRLRERSR